jgi:hypothetical protein
MNSALRTIVTLYGMTTFCVFLLLLTAFPSVSVNIIALLSVCSTLLGAIAIGGMMYIFACMLMLLNTAKRMWFVFRYPHIINDYTTYCTLVREMVANSRRR